MFHKALLCSGVKMKLFLIISLISIVNCNSNEILKLSKWLSNPNFDFSHVPLEEKSLCQKHLELYTKSLNGGNGVPKPWAIKSKFTPLMSFQV